MKRISAIKRKVILIKNHVSERLKIRVNRDFKKYKNIWHARHEKKISLPNFKIKTEEIITPKNLDIIDKTSREELLKAINQTKKALKKGHKIKINFDGTTNLIPGGTLIYIAHIEQMLKEFPRMIRCDYPKSDIVEQLFQHIKILDKLGLPSSKKIISDNVRHWYYLTGSNADMSEIVELFKHYKENLTEKIQSGLFDSISEAVTNTINHAYQNPDKKKKNQNKNWWMAAQQLDGHLDVVVYDMGIGIPGSLRRKPGLREFLKKWVTHFHRKDSVLIKTAIESQETVTLLPYRGKGLPDMLAYAKENKVADFTIFSLKGGYILSESTFPEAKCLDFDIPLKGTLLHWSIPLQNLKND